MKHDLALILEDHNQRICGALYYENDNNMALDYESIEENFLDSIQNFEWPENEDSETALMVLLECYATYFNTDTDKVYYIGDDAFSRDLKLHNYVVSAYENHNSNFVTVDHVWANVIFNSRPETVIIKKNYNERIEDV